MTRFLTDERSESRSYGRGWDQKLTKTRNVFLSCAGMLQLITTLYPYTASFRPPRVSERGCVWMLVVSPHRNWRETCTDRWRLFFLQPHQVRTQLHGQCCCLSWPRHIGNDRRFMTNADILILRSCSFMWNLACLLPVQKNSHWVTLKRPQYCSTSTLHFTALFLSYALHTFRMN